MHHFHGIRFSKNNHIDNEHRAPFFSGKSCKDCIEVGSQTWLLATALSEVSKINDGMSRENGEVAVLLSCRHDAFFCSLIWLIKMASLSPSSFHLKVFVLHYFEAAPCRR